MLPDLVFPSAQTLQAMLALYSKEAERHSGGQIGVVYRHCWQLMPEAAKFLSVRVESFSRDDLIQYIVDVAS